MTEIERLAAKALQAAQTGDWPLAVDLNQQLLASDSENLGALNRLAKAYIELNKLKKALAIYRQVLEIDIYNSIALKNLKRLNNFSSEVKSRGNGNHEVNFIEEPGITRSVFLVNVGEAKILASVDAGDPVQLAARKRFVCVTTEIGNLHLGKLPEDLSLRLINLMNAGNRYEAWVKAIRELEIEVFLREVFRSPMYDSIPSFPDGNHSAYLAFTDPSTAYQDRPDITSTEEQE